LLSVAAAAFVSHHTMDRVVPKLVSFAVGTLLGVAFLELLPHAFESAADAHSLSGALLVGILFFFLLEKTSLWRHSHHHEHDGHHHDHGFDAHAAGTNGLKILIGDGLHNFSDGILIAAAFVSDIKLGIVTTIGIVAHEIPQEVGDFLILRSAGFSRAKALWYNVASSFTSVIGGVLGYFLFAQISEWMPFVLVLAASSFIYLAVADLIPEMQQRNDSGSSLWQVAMLALGLYLVYLTHSLAH
jgi:zinc and cadmium transporter